MEQRNVKKTTSIWDKGNVGEMLNMHVTRVLESEEGERIVQKPDLRNSSQYIFF